MVSPSARPPTSLDPAPVLRGSFSSPWGPFGRPKPFFFLTWQPSAPGIEIIPSARCPGASEVVAQGQFDAGIGISRALAQRTPRRVQRPSLGG